MLNKQACFYLYFLDRVRSVTLKFIAFVVEALQVVQVNTASVDLCREGTYERL